MQIHNKEIFSNIKLKSIYRPSMGTYQPLPAFLTVVQAGFPSPADDYVERTMDLNQLMIKHPAATFFVKVEGESMCDANIHSGDILVVDRSIEPAHGQIIVAILNSEFTVKRMHFTSEGIVLVPENRAYPILKVSLESDFQVWGVVTYVIHKPK